MAYNFLSIVNEICRKLNEVELTSSNFANASGFYAAVKDSVNNAIRDINQNHFEWPFNHDTVDETLSVGLSRYPIPPNVSTVDFDSFRVKQNDTFGNSTHWLKPLTYDDYLKKYIDQEYTSDASARGVPRHVVQTPSNEFIVVPAPDQEYEIAYDTYLVGVDLINYDDVPYVPERFKHVIVDGGMYHAYMFRGNEQSATISKNKFEDGMKNMRVILINRFNYVTSTYISTRSSVPGRIF